MSQDYFITYGDWNVEQRTYEINITEKFLECVCDDAYRIELIKCGFQIVNDPQEAVVLTILFNFDLDKHDGRVDIAAFSHHTGQTLNIRTTSYKEALEVNHIIEWLMFT